MKTISLKKSSWSLEISILKDGISFESGNFNKLTIVPSPVFYMKIEDVNSNIDAMDFSSSFVTVQYSEFDNKTKFYDVDSSTNWGKVDYNQFDNKIQFTLSEHKDYKDITIIVEGDIDEKGISWGIEVKNSSKEYSVTSITYPTPSLKGKPLNLFVPDCSGVAIMNVGEKGYSVRDFYPGHNMAMQYFAWWGNDGGVYIGVHDPKACMKTFYINAKNDVGQLKLFFEGVGAGLPSNSFSVSGCIRWEVITGDWYDATLLYADFVHNSAEWLPEKGRPDTPKQFKDVPYWIYEWVTLSKKQKDSLPSSMFFLSDKYGKDYWYEAAISLKKRLGTPVGFHVYYWHEIPFDINYPHFMPARDEAVEGIKKLKEAGLYVFPYINAVSWEMHDADEGFEENFSNVGINGAILNKNGEILCQPYPRVKTSGEKTQLAPICPTFVRWHEIMEELSRKMEKELDIDGIYFDQVASIYSWPCRNPKHNHLPGGGSYFVDGYNQMMEKINKNKPSDKFYFTESNAEPYIKSFDGFLTWAWKRCDDVPAFPIVYAGYIQMIGRNTDDKRREDDNFFRYHLAQGLLFGQQIGWLNACVVYDENRMQFLEKIVHARYKHTDLFNHGHILRPPHVKTSVQPITSSDVTMRPVLSGVWQMDKPSENGQNKTVLFVINISQESAEVDLKLFPNEYKVNCPEEIHLTLEPLSIKIIEYGEEL